MGTHSQLLCDVCDFVMDLVDLELRRGRGHTGVYLSQKTNKGCAQVQFKDAS